ncbi:MAG TPA: ATP-binding protein, partial [Candidatus Binatia bacterium]|nr:ATP-binding protein [Candidatus Binatia bacterium]
MEQTELFYEERFLKSWAGSIITDPTTAIVELVANCWDAYATEVKIDWPDPTTQKQFAISDDGHGMTREEFQYIWRALSYDRVTRHGPIMHPPHDVQGPPRRVYARNGKGRFASFCFSSAYYITSRKDGQQFTYRVSRTLSKPLIIEEVEFIEKGVHGHGTEIKGAGSIHSLSLPEEHARESVGSRFLTDPAFRVYLNGEQITFSNIGNACLAIEEIDIDDAGKVKILHIDTLKADKTTMQHGIAWWVLNRVVGDCRWSSSDYERILDGRTSEAKRYTFIVQADCLKDTNAVRDDWLWFNENNKTWQAVRPVVQDKIKEMISESSKAERDAKRQTVFEKIGGAVNTLPPLSKDRVETFVNEVIDNCPTFGEQEIFQLSAILTRLEKAQSRYGL